MTSQKYKIIIPTYKRDWHTIKCLELIKNNPECIFTIAVREAEYKKYIEMTNTFKNIEFMKLYNSTNIGTTRAEIIDRLYKKKECRYCLMLDDTIFNIEDTTDKSKKLVDIVEFMIKRFETDKLREKGVAYLIPPRIKQSRYKYFGTQLCQAYMIDIIKLCQNKLNFIDTDICGVEDLCLLNDIIMKKLIVYTDNHIIRIALPPCSDKIGGTHYKDSYNIKFNRLETYVKEKYKDCPYLIFKHFKRPSKISGLTDIAEFNCSKAYKALICKEYKNEN